MAKDGALDQIWSNLPAFFGATLPEGGAWTAAKAASGLVLFTITDGSRAKSRVTLLPGSTHLNGKQPEGFEAAKFVMGALFGAQTTKAEDAIKAHLGAFATIGGDATTTEQLGELLHGSVYPFTRTQAAVLAAEGLFLKPQLDTTKVRQILAGQLNVKRGNWEVSAAQADDDGILNMSLAHSHDFPPALVAAMVEYGVAIRPGEREDREVRQPFSTAKDESLGNSPRISSGKKPRKG